MTSPSASNGPVFAAPHAAPPVGTLLSPPPVPRRGRPLGTWALLLSVMGTVLASAIGGFAAYRSARGAAPGLGSMSTATGFDWRVLTPVRDLVLLAEVSFWAGTVVGIAAFVLGIVAVSRRAATGAGVAAIVLSVLGPFIFGGLAVVAVIAGVSAGLDTVTGV